MKRSAPESFVKKLYHLNAILRAIRNVNQLIVSEKDPKRLIRSASRLLMGTKGFLSVWIVVFDENGNYRDSSQAGFGKSFSKIKTILKENRMPFCAQSAIECQNVVLIKNPSVNCSGCPLQKNYAGRDALTVGLNYKDKRYGILSVSAEPDFSGNTENQKLLKEVAGDLAFALYTIELEQKHEEIQNTVKISESLFRTTLYSIGDAVLTTDKQGKIQQMNPVAEQLTGWKEAEASGKPLKKVFKIINEESRKTVENPVERVLREGIIVGLANHTLLISKDGAEIPIADSGAPIWDDTGNITGVVLVFRDQTKEREAQRAIREAKEYAENIIATVREPLLVLNKNLKILSANRSFYRTFKVTQQDTIGKYIYDIGNREWNIPELRNLLEKILPQNTSFNDFEITHHFNYIGARTMLLNARRVYKEPDKTEMILLAIEDITERKQTEEKLNKSYRLYATLSQINQTIVRERDELKLLQGICNIAVKYGKFRLAWIGLVDQESMLVKPVAFSGEGSDYLKNIEISVDTGFFGEGPTGKAIRERRSVAFNDLENNPDFKPWRKQALEKGYRSSASFPIRLNNEAMGALNVFAAEPHFFDREEIKLLEEVASDISFAIEKIEEEKKRRQAEENLYIKDFAFHSSLSADSIGNTEGILIHANPAFAKIWGYDSAEEIIGKPILDFLADKDLASEIINSLNSTGRWSGEYLALKKDGSTFTAHASANAVYDTDGNQVAIYSSVADVTAQKQTEKALRNSEEKMRSIFRVAPIGIGVIKNRILLEVNPRICEMSGFEKHELIGKNARMLYATQEEFDYVGIEKYRQIREYGTGSVETCWQKKDGSIIDILLVSTPLETNDRSKGIIFTALEITEQKRADKEIRDTKDQLELIIDKIPGMLAYVDVTGKYKYVNKAYAQFYNLPKEKFIEKQVKHILPDYIYNKVKDKIKQVQNGKTLRFENEYQFEDGQKKVVFVEYIPQFNKKGHVLAFLAVIQDITERRKIEKALIDSEANYRALFEGISDALFVHPLKDEGFANFVAVNDAACNRYGYTREEFMNMSPKDISAPQDARLRSSREGREKLLKDNWMIFEARHISKQGKRFPVEISSRIFELKGQKVIMAMARDITERKQAEQRIRESEERFRLAFNTIPDAVSLSRVSDGLYIDVNERFCELTGYSHEEVIGKRSEDLELWTNPAERSIFVEEIKSKQVIENMEFDFRVKGGEIVTGLVSAGILQLHREKVLLSITRDISAMKRAQAERERLAIGIEYAAEAVVITDINGDIQYVNPAFEKVSGYPREEAIGQNPRILKSGKQDNAFYIELWNTITAGNVWHGKFVNRKKNGELYIEETTISPVYDKNKQIMNFVAVKRDVTKEEELEQQFMQAQKMESIGRLAGGVAHDFNNMLSVILGYSELALANMNPEDKCYKNIEEIRNAGKRSADLTSQLLAFSRKQTIAPRVVNLNEAVRKMLKMLRRLIGEDINLIWKPGENLGNIYIDPTQVDQMLANLCVNSRDAINGAGEIIIETKQAVFSEAYCERHTYASPGVYIQLTVSDDGCGMEKSVKEKIFEPFFTTKVKGKGTGLGLATVYGIVKQNEGLINVYSEPGNGTSFKLYFPLYTEIPDIDIIEEEIKYPLGNGERILMVEDEPSIMEMTKTMLENLNYTVIATTSPEEALILAAEQNEEVVLLLSDVVMPGMNGKQLADHLKKIHPDMNVLFMSGYTTDVIANRGVLEEGVNFISKPFALPDLAKKIYEVLK